MTSWFNTTQRPQRAMTVEDIAYGEWVCRKMFKCARRHVASTNEEERKGLRLVINELNERAQEVTRDMKKVYEY